LLYQITKITPRFEEPGGCEHIHGHIFSSIHLTGSESVNAEIEGADDKQKQKERKTGVIFYININYIDREYWEGCTEEKNKKLA
jgi:hypothetical protein